MAASDPRPPSFVLTEKKDVFHLEELQDAEHKSAVEINGAVGDTVDLDYPGEGLSGFLENKYVVLCALLASIGGLSFGYDQGVISVTLVMDHFLARFPRIDPDASSNAGFWKGLMTAMIELGAMIGAASAGFTAERYSRKKAIAIGVIFFVIGASIQTGSTDYSMLVVGRLIGGVGVGTLSVVAPMYMSEVSPPKIRGALLVLEEWNIVFGIVVAFWLTYGTRFWNSEWSWRFPFALQIAPALLLGFGIMLLPYSPRWLVTKGRDSECLASLCRLRRLPPTDPRVQKEYIEIRAEAAFQREVQITRHPKLLSGPNQDSFLTALKLEAAGWVDLFRKGCWRRTVVGAGLMFFQQLLGINALIYYSPTLFETLGLGYDMRLTMSGVMNVCQLIGTLFSFFLMDKLGRRPLLLCGSVGVTICHAVVAGLVGTYKNEWASHSGAGWAGVAFILVYMLTFGTSWGSVPWVMPSEIFSSSLRSKGVAISTVSCWFNNLIIGLFTPPLIQNTQEGAFIFFAVFSFLSFFFVWFMVPETANRTLEEMDAVFGDNANKEDEAKMAAIMERIKREGARATVGGEGNAA